jgi:hypothetical protein
MWTALTILACVHLGFVMATGELAASGARFSGR